MTTTTNTRTVEKLIALFRYESEPGRGCSSAETLGDLFDVAREVVLNGDFPESPTEAEMDDLHARCVTMSEYLLRGMVAAGFLAEAEKCIEDIATDRRRCEARFRMERDIPFSEDERRQLSAEWSADAAADLESVQMPVNVQDIAATA